MLSKENRVSYRFWNTRGSPELQGSYSRHNVVLLVDASCQGTDNLLRRKGKPQRTERAHGPVDLCHGRVFADHSQEDVTGFVGHRDLKV